MSNSLDPDQAQHFVGPDRVQTVCKSYQQMTKVATGGKTVNMNKQPLLFYFTFCTKFKHS